MYVAIDIRHNGIKEVLGMWIGGNESAKYWLGVLNEVKNRGIEDIMIVSIDGLTRFDDAISVEIRKIIYTTNSIENFNRGLRKVTKAKAVFPTDDALFKSIYLAMIDITKKWTGTSWNWGQTLNQLCIYFGDRITPTDLE